MGNCIFCNQPAGFLRSEHKECRSRHDAGLRSVESMAASALAEGRSLPELRSRVDEIATVAQLDKTNVRVGLVRSWEKAVATFLEDGLLTEKEEGLLHAFMTEFSLDQHALDRNGVFSRVVKAGVLRDLLNGKLPERVSVTGSLPFNLQKAEKLVWVFPNTPYYTEKVARQYVGRSAGVSVRIAKGVYYRTSAFRGHPIETTYASHEDTGLLGVSTKHIYFAGSRKSFRIAHSKVVSLQPFTDGIGLYKDGANPKPQYFTTGDGWFTYNLLTNVTQL